MRMRVAAVAVVVYVAVIAFVLAGCASTRSKSVDLPETSSVESIQLQFCDDSCTVSKAVDIIDDNKNVISELIASSCGKWSESVNDSPQEVPFVIINIFTENHEDDRALYLYKKGKNFYVEQPYIGRWTTSEDLYDMVCSYAEHG